MAESLHVDLTASAGGFIGAVEASTASLKTLEKQAAGMGAIGSFLSKTVLPAATAIAGAFAASKALSAFGESDLPGAKAYSEALKSSRESVTRLAAAVGEYLAPAAIKVANWITAIADRLTPLVRQFTAFSESATQFLLKLGSNALEAFRFIMPGVDALATRIENLFSGPAHDWMADVEAFRNWWNDTWDSILAFTAPILVSLAQLIDTGITLGINLATAAFEGLQSTLGSFGGEGAAVVQTLTDSIQNGLVTAIGAVEFTLKNLPEALSIVGDYMTIIWQNAVTAITFFGTEAKNLFTEIFGPDGFVVRLLTEVFTSYLPNLIKHSVLFIAANATAWAGGGQGGIPMVGTHFSKSKTGFNFTPGEFPAMQAVGSGGSASFMSGMGDFLKDRLPKINDTAAMFIDAVKFMLPDVTAKVNDFVAGNPILRDAESTKHTGLAMEGSREAYKAILKYQDRAQNESLELQKAQLNEQKKTNDKLAAAGGLAMVQIP
jgi:hypothetical protein